MVLVVVMFRNGKETEHEFRGMARAKKFAKAQLNNREVYGCEYYA